MNLNVPFNLRSGILAILLMGSVWMGGTFFWPDSPPAFGGGFAPQMSQQGPRYQIAGCDANSAWVIDTASGDVYLIYANGKWKEVGSIMDEKKRIKTKP